MKTAYKFRMYPNKQQEAMLDVTRHLPTNELAGMPPRLGACLCTKSREAYGRVTLLPD